MRANMTKEKEITVSKDGYFLNKRVRVYQVIYNNTHFAWDVLYIWRRYMMDQKTLISRIFIMFNLLLFVYEIIFVQ